MQCLVILVATIIFCQNIIATPFVRQRRGYFGHNHKFANPSEVQDPFIDPSWWRDLRQHSTVTPSGHYDIFGINHGDFSDGSRGRETRPPMGPSPSNTHGEYIGWGLQTTKKPYPIYPDANPSSKEKNRNKNEQIALCIQLCSIAFDSSEHNPVCGSNNVTYKNPGRLECAQRCGVAVQLRKLSPCTDTEHTTTQRTEEQTLACIRSCPVTTEYNPVCGTNNETYTNLGRLECAQNCGLAINLSRQTSCTAPLTTEEINSINVTRDVSMTMKNTTELNKISAINSTTPRPFINVNSNWGNIVNNTNNKSGENYPNEETNLNSENGVSNESRKDNDNGENNSSNDNGKNNLNEENNGARGTKGYNGGGSYNGNNVPGGNNFNGGHGGNYGKPGHYTGNNFHGGHEGNYGNPGHNTGNNFHGGHEGNYGNPGHNTGNNCHGVNNQNPQSIKEVMACMQLCTLTSEFNPVCGTDNITYTNPGRLLCAQFCGLDVRVKKFAPCSSTSNTNFHCPTICTNPPVTENPGTITPPTPSIQGCIDSCSASTEFKPVCGTNNITYRNLEKLRCARLCGIDVSLLRNSHCSAPDAIPTGLNGNPPVSNNTEKPSNSSSQVAQDSQECIKQCSVPQNYDPICGSDNVTYNNTDHLICARQCGLDVRVKQLSPCSDDGLPSPNPTTEKEPVSPGPNTLNFTISPDVLADIWSDTTTAKDGSEEFDLDQRFQDNQ